MQLLRSYPASKRTLDWWYGIAVAIAVSQCALTLVLKQGVFLTAYTNISYFLLILVPGGIAAGNAVRSSQAIRLFWLFLAVGFALWALSAGFWVEAILRGRASPVPDISVSNPPLFLHVVFFMAAAVTRPHLNWPSRKLYRTTANFLLLLFFWFFIYTFLQFPYHHTSREFSRYSALYFTENIALLAVLGWLIARVHGPWRRVYAHFFGASALYATGSLVNNMVTSRSGYKGGLYDVPLFAALCWLVWVTLLGRKTVHELEESRQPTIFSLRYISLLATLAMVAIPATGLWELYRADEPYETRVIRLLIVLLSVSFLAVCAFIKGYLANRELSSDVSLADERFRLAIHAGKMYAYEWDVATDVVIRSEEYVNILGFTEQTGKSTRQEVLTRVHPDDRTLFADSIDRLIPENPTTQISYRVVRPDGSVVWLEKSARAFFNQQGRMLRVVGMVMDITEHEAGGGERSQA